MRVAVVGAGFTGLTAAYELTKKGYAVTVFERESYVGGLASGIRHAVEDYPENWDWDLERFYHHWFTNDEAVLNLIDELGVRDKLIVKRPITATWFNGQAYQLDSPLSLLSFSPISLISRLRTGAALAYLKYAIGPDKTKKFENVTASTWLKKWMGREAYQVIWEPLLQGKFDEYYKEISMTWFWARIFKRTPKLVYFKGGFGALVDLLVERIKRQGGEIRLGKAAPAPIFLDGEAFDKLILTTPPPVLVKLFPNLPVDYRDKLTTQKGIGAYVLILALEKPFLPDNIYWLNINDPQVPFLAAVEHTNFVDSSHYGGKHLLYIGDYLPADHPRMQMTKGELVEEVVPYLKRFNANFQLSTFNCQSWLFREPYAQPIVGLNHAQKILPFETPVKNVYLASMAQVYPWDRGTNYAVELGKRVVEKIIEGES